jgi:hypothetical protein
LEAIMAQQRNPDLSINFDDWLRSRLAQYAGTTGNGDAPIDNQRELRIATRAVQLYAESHPRPTQVNQKQAAEMLGISARTVRNMLKAGTLKLNRCGMISIAQVDAALLPYS